MAFYQTLLSKAQEVTKMYQFGSPSIAPFLVLAPVSVIFYRSIAIISVKLSLFEFGFGERLRFRCAQEVCIYTYTRGLILTLKESGERHNMRWNFAWVVIL